MKRDAIESYQVAGLQVAIYQDDDPQSPREDDNFGHMVCWHRRYTLGDDGVGAHGKRSAREFAEPSDFTDWAKGQKGIIVLPLYLYDHSGITISTGPFSCPWDSGQVGYIYATREDVLKNWNAKRISKKLVEKARALLVAEVETYDQYLTGQVYGYTVETPDGENLDSCWGFYGLEYCKGEATSAAEWQAKHRAEEYQERLAGESESAGDSPIQSNAEVK